MKLLMVTDTFVKKDETGQGYALEPVQREVDGFSHLFDNITWIGYDWSRIKKNKFLSPVKSANIDIRVINAAGGRTILKKAEAVFTGLSLIPLLIKEIRKHDVIHTRGPSMPALFAVALSFMFRKKIFWNKFAGNWKQENAPLSYSFLRNLLTRASFSKVTINGKWEGQPAHCLSFENPCLTDEELQEGERNILQKDYAGKLDFCFIGRIEAAKGVGRILNMFEQLGDHPKVGTVHFIGEGDAKEGYEKRASSLPVKIAFHGYLSREKVVDILEQCHVFLLLSESEGFPKVIAESANYGCIPFVSDVSSIGQYIKNGYNGFITNDLSDKNLVKILSRILEEKGLKRYALNLREMLDKYTYSYYSERIKTEILNR